MSHPGSVATRKASVGRRLVKGDDLRPEKGRKLARPSTNVVARLRTSVDRDPRDIRDDPTAPRRGLRPLIGVHDI